MRPSWDSYWLQMAKVAAKRSTCPRLSVGCVLVRENQLVSTGYNGAGPGQPECTQVGCDLVSGRGCQRTHHAEANAVCFAARRGVSTLGATTYVTHSCCAACAKLLVMAGISSVVYLELYRDQTPLELLTANGVQVSQGSI